MTYQVYVITLQETKIWKKRMRDKGDDEMITSERVLEEWKGEGARCRCITTNKHGQQITMRIDSR